MTQQLSRGNYKPLLCEIMATMDCVSKVQLHVSCEGLKDKDLLSKSDPICAVYVWDEKYKQWREVGMLKSEIITVCFAVK